MPSVRKNKIQVPVNSDAWNLTPDLATMADTTNAPIKVASAAERDALASPANGDKVIRTDLPGAPFETYDTGSSSWQEPWVDFGAPVAIAGSWTTSGSFKGIRLGSRYLVTATVQLIRTTSTLSLPGGSVAYTNLGIFIPAEARASSSVPITLTNYISGNGASDLIQTYINIVSGEIQVRGYPGAVSWVTAAQINFQLVYMT